MRKIILSHPPPIFLFFRLAPLLFAVQWPDSAANARKAKEEAEAARNAVPVQFTPPALEPGIVSGAFPDGAQVSCLRLH